MEFRTLDAGDIECRVAQVSKKGTGLSLLLYKDARVDANILDETVGPENWRCRFYEAKGTMFCSVGIRVDRGDGSFEWVDKDDAGAPSAMEAVKGEASDAFKRACFRWGIGRELYTAPFIWIPSQVCNIYDFNGKWVCRDRFSVAKIRIEDRVITGLAIRNDETGKIVFTMVKEKNK